MPTCSVAGCTKEKRNAIDPDHKFFSFPRKSPLVEKWIKFCRKDSLTKEQCMTKGQRICSIHFKEEYIEIPLKYRLLPQFAPKNMRILRKDAVPTIRNPKKRKEDEDDEKQKKKKLEYSRIVAELLEQSEKDAMAEKERQDKETEEAVVNEQEAVTQQNVKHEESTPRKKPAKSKKQSTSIKEKSPKKMKREQPSPDTVKDTPKSRNGNSKSAPSTKTSKRKTSNQKKKVSFADHQPPDTDDEIEVCEPDFQSEDADTEAVMNNSNQQAEDNAAELLRLQRENKKLTDLTIKQSLQIADLIKQRNDLWREKGDLWFRKRMDPQSVGVLNVS